MLNYDKKDIFSIFFAQPLLAFNLIYKLPGYSTSFSAAESKKIAAIVEKFEWPSSVNLFTDNFGKTVNKKMLAQSANLTADADNAETDFIRTQLKTISPTIEVAWMPQTLWDLIAILASYQVNLSTSGFKGRQDLTQFAFKLLKEIHGLSLPSVSFDNNAVNEKTVQALLKRFQKPGNGFLEGKIKDALIGEIPLIKKQQSPIMNSLRQDIDARLKNHVLLFRATNGVVIGDTGRLSALDFVAPSAAQKKSVMSAAANLFSLVENDDPKTIDLSYQYSLLGGCLDDIFICPYYFYNVENYKVLYVLSLSRSFAQLRAHQLIYFPKANAFDLTMSENILGHPRFRLFGPFLRPFDEVFGGSAFKIGFYQPLKNSLIDNIADMNSKKYLSFLLETGAMLVNDAVIVAIHQKGGKGKALTVPELKHGQQTAFDILKDAIETIKVDILR